MTTEHACGNGGAWWILYRQHCETCEGNVRQFVVPQCGYQLSIRDMQHGRPSRTKTGYPQDRPGSSKHQELRNRETKEKPSSYPKNRYCLAVQPGQFPSSRTSTLSRRPPHPIYRRRTPRPTLHGVASDAVGGEPRYTVLVVTLRRLPQPPQVRQETTMPKRETMPFMMALMMPATPVTTAMMAAPMVANMDEICMAAVSMGWSNCVGELGDIHSSRRHPWRRLLSCWEMYVVLAPE